MKKTILFIMAMILAFGAAATDRFYIEDFTINPGETITVSIQLDNEVSYTAFQSDLFMPEGLTATNFALTDRKNSNHTFTATILPDGGIRLLSYSLKLKTYSDNSGALVTFDVTSSEDFEGDASIRLTGTIFTTEAGLEVPFDDENCTVSLSATGIRGDVNGDNVVNIADVTALIDILLGSSTAPSSADCNLDNAVNISDVTSLIDYLLSGSWN